MAYVIITAVPWGENLGARDKKAVTSRRAVATLDEARTIVHAATIAQHATRWPLYEPGGKIGPLPDGTVIEVEHWGAARAVNWMVEQGHDPAVESFIDVYNADTTKETA